MSDFTFTRLELYVMKELENIESNTENFKNSDVTPYNEAMRQVCHNGVEALLSGDYHKADEVKVSGKGFFSGSSQSGSFTPRSGL